MDRLGWAFLAAVLAVQCMTLAITLGEKDKEKRIREIDEQTAIMKNEAAALSLESERIRNNYYKALEQSPFNQE